MTIIVTGANRGLGLVIGPSLASVMELIGLFDR